MFARLGSKRSWALRWGLPLVVAGMLLVIGGQSHAQVIQQAVGGVAISTDGVLTVVKTDVLQDLAGKRRKALAQLPGDLNQPAKMRSISLARLQAAIGE